MKTPSRKYLPLGVSIIDDLIDIGGVEPGTNILICCSVGTGKTLFAMQSLYNAALRGEKSVYITFEENGKRLKDHMSNSFGWDLDTLESKNKMAIQAIDPFEMAAAIEASVRRKIEGKSLMGIKGVELPFKPDRIAIDSLSAISSAFVNVNLYRMYIQTLFNDLMKYGSVNLIISEMVQRPEVYESLGIESILADTVIALYSIRKEQARLRGVEIIKHRASDHSKKIVPFKITKNGIEMFGEETMFV